MKTLTKVKAWINAVRLRTLPLSISGILVGTALAEFQGCQDSIIFALALWTTVSFQITSNFANDYGDGVKGTDNDDRIGPKRAYQSRLLSRKELKNGIIISIIINILSVIAVIFFSFRMEHLEYIMVFAALGLISIWAAIKYTIGNLAYGYKGLGDIFVFLFFGLLSVMGSMFLYTKSLTLLALFPAITIGLLSVGVLNLNNLRDCKSDKNAGKNTIVVKIGYLNGKKYHAILLIVSFLFMLLFSLKNYNTLLSLVHLLVFIPIFIHLKKVLLTKKPVLLDSELKKLAMGTFLLALLFYLVASSH